MPAAQGRLPRIAPLMRGRLVGENPNGELTNDSVEYRGKPFCRVNAIDMAALDAQRERVVPSWQRGLRVVGYWLQTSRIIPRTS